MEQNQETSLFGFGIDQTSRTHLAEAARWAKFLSIIGFILCGLAAIVGIISGMVLSISSTGYSEYRTNSTFGASMGILVFVVYIGMSILYFFPCLFLLRFANRIKIALNTDDQLSLNSSFQNLKILFRYFAIITIVVISLYILFFLFVAIYSASVGM